MPIYNMWFNYKMQCIEMFLSRAFEVNDEYTRALDHAETEAEYDHASDMLLGYQDIVFRAVYLELNALVEHELKSLARSILEARREKLPRLNRGTVRTIIEQEYKIKFEDLPRFDEVDEIREISNAYKHDNGFSGAYEEISPGAGWLFGYRETRYTLDWDKTYQSVQAVKEFMQALPGERERLPEDRFKSEDEATIQARRKVWDYLRRSGALGHDFGEPTPVTDEREGYRAVCKLCGKSFWHEHEKMFRLIAVMDKCPGVPELQKDQQVIGIHERDRQRKGGSV